MLISLESEDDEFYASKHYPHVETVFQALQSRLVKAEVCYARGCDLNSGRTDGIPEAVQLAAGSDVAVLVLGERSGMTRNCSSGEARDRATLDLPGQQMRLLREVALTKTPVVLVLINERPLNLTWASENVSAILEAWLPGEEGGAAVAELLAGSENPSGKLPITFPREVGQIPIYYNHTYSGCSSKWFGDYVECSNKPLYPFGHGLGYTRFTMDNLRLSAAEIAMDGRLLISIDVANMGIVVGDEVVQLYLHHEDVAVVARPHMELCGFHRLTLTPLEKATVEFSFVPNQLGYIDECDDFVVAPGGVKVMIGSSSEDLRAEGRFRIVGEKTVQGGYESFISDSRIIRSSCFA